MILQFFTAFTYKPRQIHYSTYACECVIQFECSLILFLLPITSIETLWAAPAPEQVIHCIDNHNGMFASMAIIKIL